MNWQYLGSLVWWLIGIGLGIYVVAFAPKKIQQRVSNGAMSADAAMRAGKTVRWAGALMIIGGLAMFVATLFHWVS